MARQSDAARPSHDVSTVILPAAVRRRRTLWLSVAAVVLVLAAGAVFQLVSNSRHPQAPLNSTGEPAGVSPRTNSPANDVRGLTPPDSPSSESPSSESATPPSDNPKSKIENQKSKDDWPEWAKEIQEPPPLEEWLKGRKELTVKQDGSAQFTTIQAALDKVQPGEVIRVLDKGPYRERLTKSFHPGNFGLVSDVNTVIELAKWELEPKFKTAWLGHFITAIPNVRISGFTFICTPPEEDKSLDPAPVPNPIYTQELRGLCFEDCVVLAPQQPDNPQSNVTAQSLMPIDTADSLCVRRCIFGLWLRVPVVASASYTTLLSQNYLCGQQSKSYQLSFVLGATQHRVRVDQNVFHSLAAFHAIAIGAENSVVGEGAVLLTRNTLSSHPTISTLTTGHGFPGRRVVVSDNILSASTQGFCFSDTGAKPFAAKAREEWLIQNNWGGQRSPLSDWVPLTDASHTGELPYLSLDPEHPNFLRLDPAKLPPDGTRIPGALPPGPPPPEGDWFTRLQARLKEAQAASRAQFTK